MTTNRKIVLDNKLKFIKESSNWYKNNGYCNKPFKWNFKIFHVEPEVLYDICTQLVENDFVYSSIKWNKSADYDVRGWVLSVYTIAAFTEEALTNIRMKMEMWLHDMTQEAFSSYSYLNTNSKDDKEHDEGIKLKGDIIEFEPFRIPKRTVQNTNWEERWHKSLNKELKLLKEPLKEFSTDKLDKAFIDVQNSKEDATNTWVEFLTFVLKGKSIYFTDLRPGPCEDGVNVKLDKGNYDAFVYLKSTNNLPLIAAIKLVIKGSKYSERNQVGSISVDGGSVGFYDYDRIRSCFGYDMEELYSWGESRMLNQINEYGVLTYDLKRNYILPFVQSGEGDGVYPVYECSGLIAPDTLIRDNSSQTLRCHYEQETSV